MAISRDEWKMLYQQTMSKMWMGMGVVGELTQLAALLGILQTGKVFEIN